MNEPIRHGTPHLDLHAATHNPLYHLERHDVGVVHIDNEFRVVAMNAFARRVLPVDAMQPFHKSVLAFHPPRSQAKVQFLLERADHATDNPPPMTMLINIPERVLLINVTRMSDTDNARRGFTLVFYDITDAVSVTDVMTEGASQVVAGKRQLAKIPTVVNNRILLMDAAATAFIRAEGHYTWVHGATGANFCNLNIGDLEERLENAAFLRVHRSYLANLNHAEQILRDDGRVRLKLRNVSEALPVARTVVATLLNRLGID